MELFLDTDVSKFFEIRDKCRVPSPPYWTAEVYGFGKEIRKYGFYPRTLPLYVNTDHGVSSTGIIYEAEIACDAPVQFYHLPLTVEKWRRQFSKPCYVLHSPFVFYRRRNNIAKANDANGTLVFPAHTTPEIDDISSIDKYISDLEKLPDCYKPISICLHYHDVMKGAHKIYLKKDYRVFSAGHPNDYGFIPNFYGILKNFKFSTSNMFMSCLFYSVEMDIPHFIYGNQPILINHADSNLDPGNYDVLKIPRVNTITKMFEGPSQSITHEQKSLVEYDLGLTEPTSRIKMAYLLYHSFVTHTMRAKKNQILDAARGMKRRVFKLFN